MTHNDFKMGFVCGSDGKVSACNARDPDQFLGWKDYLEKRMATHFSLFFFFAWRMLWTEQTTVFGAAKICTKYTLYISSWTDT